MFSYLEPTSTSPSAPHTGLLRDILAWCLCIARSTRCHKSAIETCSPAWWDTSGLHLPPQRDAMHFHLEASWLLPSSYIGPPMSPRQCKMAGPIVKMVGFWLSDWSGPRRLLLEPAVTQSLLRCDAAFRFKVQEASHQRTSSFRFTLEVSEFSQLSPKAGFTCVNYSKQKNRITPIVKYYKYIIYPIKAIKYMCVCVCTCVRNRFIVAAYVLGMRG